MSKQFSDIVQWGKVKRFKNPPFNFNSIDIETINNEPFLIGSISNGIYTYTLGNFWVYLNELILSSVRHNRDIATWTRYDNTFIFKILAGHLDRAEIPAILARVGRVSPLFSYEYKDYTIILDNIIADNIILSVIDKYSNKKRLNIYNIKNLIDSDLVTASLDYDLTYYSKLGEEYHMINDQRFTNDLEYRTKVIEANRLDNQVVVDLAYKLIANFKLITGEYPRTMYTAGSLARAYLLTHKDLNFNIRSYFGRLKIFNDLADYSMRSYFGGKIESYILGYIPHAQVIDITSAYPYALSKLPELTKDVIRSDDPTKLQDYFYAFIHCTLYIKDEKLIHPVSVRSPFNDTNISPIGRFSATITKIEYDYLLKRGVKIDIIDYIAIKHKRGVFPYQTMINDLFKARMDTWDNNPSLSQLYKLILNSLYGITYELTDVYDEKTLEWQGFRAGDFFNPIIASYITAITRTYLSSVSNNIIDNGGDVLLNMTDSIIYNGHVSLDIFSDEKILGKFEQPTSVKDVIILGAGRYEYMDEFTKNYTIKTRGFKAEQKNASYYTLLDLSKVTKIKVNGFVTLFKTSLNEYSFEQLGHIVEEEYKINPLNLGGKRIIINHDVDLKTEYTPTKPVLILL